MKEEKVEFKNSKGQRLAGVLHVPEGEGHFPAAIFVHGYGSDKNSSKSIDLSKTIPEQGLVLFRFDLSGRGESDGKFEDSTVTQYIDDLRCAIDFISGLDVADANKIGVVGNSLGGLVSLQEISKDNRIKCLVLLSPVSKAPWKKVDEFSDENVAKWKKEGHIYTYAPRFGKMKINYGFYENAQQYNDYNLYKNIKIPVLIMHGTEDASVSFDSAKKLIKYINDIEFITLRRADHLYSNKIHYNKVITKTTKFLSGHLKMGYSKRVMHTFVHPQNMGEIEKACVGDYKSPVCGDFMKIFLKVKKDIVVDAKFKTFGCCAAISSGDMLCKNIKGKSIKDISKIKKEEIVNELGGLPKAKVHCAELAVRTLRRAIEDYEKKKSLNKQVKRNK